MLEKGVLSHTVRFELIRPRTLLLTTLHFSNPICTRLPVVDDLLASLLSFQLSLNG